MATLTQTGQAAATPQARARNLGSEIAGWAQESLYGTPLMLAGNLAVFVLAVIVFRGQLQRSPALALVVGGLWLAALLWVTFSALRHRFDPVALWLKDRLYNSPASALFTLVITLWLAAAGRALWLWAVVNASFATDPAEAAASDHTGATWGVIAANLKLFLVGQFPQGQLFRVWLAAGLVGALIVASVLVYGPLSARLGRLRRLLTLLWVASPIVLWVLLRGVGTGPLGLIEPRSWGGLLLTLMITVFSIVVSFPLGVLLALGRRSRLPGIPAFVTYGVAGLVAVYGLATYTLPSWRLARSPLEYVFLLWPVWLLLAAAAFQRVYRGNAVAAASTLYIEFVRGVPLITVLFMSIIMLPLFLPANVTIEHAYRVMWGFALFTAAYMAENVRGGLQSIPRGQYEAAEALGLSTFNQLRLVILPQALRVVIPPITGMFIGLFKDTSLVAIVGLFDLLNIANAVIAQPAWLGLRYEAYFFITVIYYVGCYAMARIGYWLERRTGLGVR